MGSNNSFRTSALILVGIFFIISLHFSEGYTIGPNYRNVTIDTFANITNARPEVLNVTFSDPITLVAGGTYPFQCNISIRDWNGGNTLDTVNGTLFDTTSSLYGADDNNSHYTNSTCAETAVNGVYANYTCTFGMYYYANPGSWNCSVFVNDTAGFIGNGTDNFSINTLYALNVTNPLDYGDLAIEDISANLTANVTNFGNIGINVSVYGYGNTTGDGLAMVCEQGNISISNQRYSVDITDTWAVKTPLSGTPTQVPGLTVSKQTTPSTVVNTTYWQLYVPPNPFGVCNGSVVFQAESAT